MTFGMSSGGGTCLFNSSISSWVFSFFEEALILVTLLCTNLGNLGGRGKLFDFSALFGGEENAGDSKVAVVGSPRLESNESPGAMSLNLCDFFSLFDLAILSMLKEVSESCTWSDLKPLLDMDLVTV